MDREGVDTALASRKRHWPLGSPPLPVLLIVLHICILTFSCPPLSLPGPPKYSPCHPCWPWLFFPPATQTRKWISCLPFLWPPSSARKFISSAESCVLSFTPIFLTARWLGPSRYALRIQLISKSASSCFPKLFFPFRIPRLPERYLHPLVCSGQMLLLLVLCPNVMSHQMLSSLLSDLEFHHPFSIHTDPFVDLSPPPTWLWRIKCSG